MRDRHRGERTANAAQHAGNDQLEMDQTIDRQSEKLDADLIVAQRYCERAGHRIEIARDDKGAHGRERQRQPE
jgi:hypothetical protein